MSKGEKRLGQLDNEAQVYHSPIDPTGVDWGLTVALADHKAKALAASPSTLKKKKLVKVLGGGTQEVEASGLGHFCASGDRGIPLTLLGNVRTSPLLLTNTYFRVLQVVIRETSTSTAQLLVLVISGSFERSEEEGEEEEQGSLIRRRKRTSTPLVVVELEALVVEKRSPSVAVGRVLHGLPPQEEVVEFESGADGKLMEAKSFIFETHNEGELPVEALIKQILTQHGGDYTG